MLKLVGRKKTIIGMFLCLISASYFYLFDNHSSLCLYV